MRAPTFGGRGRGEHGPHPWREPDGQQLSLDLGRGRRAQRLGLELGLVIACAVLQVLALRRAHGRVELRGARERKL